MRRCCRYTNKQHSAGYLVTWLNEIAQVPYPCLLLPRHNLRRNLNGINENGNFEITDTN